MNKPLVRRRFAEVGLSGKALARACGVSHSQVYMARERTVGQDNAERIASYVAGRLGLSGSEKLHLKAEIMGHPEDFVRAYLGGASRAATLLGVSERVGRAVLDPTAELAHETGTKIVEKLREMHAPEEVVEAVARRVRPPGTRRPDRTLRSALATGGAARTDLATPTQKDAGEKPFLDKHMRALGISGYGLARLSGLTDTHVYRARFSNLGEKNAELIASALARELGLTEKDRLLLKAEIMGRPGHLTRAYFGGLERVMREFGVSRHTAMEILDPERWINGNNAERVARRLARGDVPTFVAGDINSRVGPPPAGKVTYSAFGLEGRNRRARTATSLQWSKPETAEALRRSGLTRKELYLRAGVGKETLRKALYVRCGEWAADALTEVLAETLSLPPERVAAIKKELVEPPGKNFFLSICP